MWKIIGLLLVCCVVLPGITGEATAAESSLPLLSSDATKDNGHSREAPERRTLSQFNTRRANMNDYMDYVMEGVADWMRAGGVTPFDLPDLREGFSYKPLLIEYSGWVDLSGGRLLDIERVYRTGDSYMSYDRLLLRVDVEVALSSILFYYDYKTTIMGLGIFEGYVDGSADDIVVHCEFLIDMYDFYIFMQNFEVVSIGNIDVRLRGNMLTDWIGNIMIDIITWLFRNTITQMVSDRVKDFMQETLDKINAGRSFMAQDGASVDVIGGARTMPEGQGANLNKGYDSMLDLLRVVMLNHGIKLPVPVIVGGQ